MKTWFTWLKNFFTFSGVSILRSYIGINLESCIPALGALFIYWIFRENGLYIHKENNDVLMKILQGLWMIYGFLATNAVISAVKKYTEIVGAIEDFKHVENQLKVSDTPDNKKKEKDARYNFKKIRKQGMPIFFHLLMGHISVLTILGNMIMYQEDMYYGMGLVAGSVFLMYFVFRVTISMEDPTVGIWKIHYPHKILEQ